MTRTPGQLHLHPVGDDLTAFDEFNHECDIYTAGFKHLCENKALNDVLVDYCHGQ